MPPRESSRSQSSNARFPSIATRVIVSRSARRNGTVALVQGVDDGMKKPLQLKLVHALGDNHVSKVGRVECSAENAESHRSEYFILYFFSNWRNTSLVRYG